MRIPIDSLSPETLRRVVEEYVTRDGTQTDDAEDMVVEVLAELRAGRAELEWDEEEETTQVVRVPEPRGGRANREA